MTNEGQEQTNLCRERAAHASTKRELNAMRESSDEANERLAALNEWVDCHKGELAATKRELEAVKSCVEVQHRAFADFLSAAQNSCKGCRGGGQDNDGEAYTGEPCPDCKWITMAIPDFMMDPSIQAKLNAEKVSEVECLRARVAELEAAKVDSESWQQQAEQRLDDANEWGRQLEQAKRELEAMHERYNQTADTLNTVGDELGSTKRELEENLVVFRAWTKAFGTTQLTHALARLESAESRANKAEARVAELEGLRITGADYSSYFVEVAAILPLGSTPTIGGTIGEAMPGGSR